MKFSTTPLFAASWYWKSWLGEPVPWNGLAYGKVNSNEVTDGTRKYRINSSGTISSSSLDTNKRLSFNVTYPDGEPSYSLITGTMKPDAVKKKGSVLPFYEDLSTANEGWSYSSNVSGMIIVKLLHGSSEITVGVENCAVSTEWTFSTNSDVEGWQAAGQVGTLSVSGGMMQVIPNGDNPGIVKTVNLQAENYSKFIVKYTIDSKKSKLMKVSWKSGSQSWDNNRSEQCGIIDDGTMKTVMLDLSKIPTWTGNIMDIKIEFLDTKANETIKMDDIRIVKDVVVKNGEMEWDFNSNGELEGWSPIKDLASLSSQDGNLTGISSNNDPVIYSNDFNTQAFDAPILQVRMKASNSPDNTQVFYNLCSSPTIYYSPRGWPFLYPLA